MPELKEVKRRLGGDRVRYWAGLRLLDPPHPPDVSGQGERMPFCGRKMRGGPGKTGQGRRKKRVMAGSWRGGPGGPGKIPHIARARKSYCRKTRRSLLHSQTNFVGKWSDRVDQEVKSNSYMGPCPDQFWTIWDKGAEL